jgi:hypothetical protein
MGGYQKKEESVTPPPPPVQASPFFAPNPAVSRDASPAKNQAAAPFASPVSSGAVNSSNPMGSPQAAKAGGQTARNGDTSMDQERRAFVNGARDYIAASADVYKLQKPGQATLDKVIPRWVAMAQKAEGVVQQIQGGQGDPALLEATHRDFATAFRTLLITAAPQLNRPAIRVYLENMYRLPVWAWPDSGVFAGADDKQKRTFAADFATALQDAALFGGYGTLDKVKLEGILGGLKNLVDGAQVMIAGQLASDNTLRQNLRDAYRQAIQTLLTRAAPAMGSSLFTLYVQYRYGSNSLIHEWGDQVVPRMTGTLPQGTPAPDPRTGQVSFMLNGFLVHILPDGTKRDRGGETKSHVHGQLPGATAPGGVVTHIDGPATPAITIQTLYGPGTSPDRTSGYGRGTTAADKLHGDTTLSYHEGSHATDYLAFIAANPAPVFGGTVGSTFDNFKDARKAYGDALHAFGRQLDKESELKTDCVGSPDIMNYYRAQGRIPPANCP